MSRHLIELSQYLATRATAYRTRRAYGDLLSTEVALSITRDIRTDQESAKREAHRANCNELEAARLLRVATADGKITREEIPMITRALRHIGCSTRATYRIGEILA